MLEDEISKHFKIPIELIDPVILNAPQLEHC